MLESMLLQQQHYSRCLVPLLMYNNSAAAVPSTTLLRNYSSWRSVQQYHQGALHADLPPRLLGNLLRWSRCEQPPRQSEYLDLIYHHTKNMLRTCSRTCCCSPQQMCPRASTAHAFMHELLHSTAHVSSPNPSFGYPPRNADGKVSPACAPSRMHAC